MKKNFEDLFFLENGCACVLGPWPWPRAFLSLASRGSVLGKAVLGLERVCPRKGCPWPWPRIFFVSLALASDFFCVLGLGLEPCVLDSTSGSNYRPIALTSVISKLLEHFILSRIETFLHTTHNQFGFKAQHSTDMCVFLLKQCVSSYVSKGSRIFSVFLDASKAFDKVSHSLLFKKSINRNVPLSFVRLLYFWYKNQTMRVRWGAEVSRSFNVTNGVGQGSVLSPLLFAVAYILINCHTVLTKLQLAVLWEMIALII